MKKPRLLTPEEIHEWRESNRLTIKKKGKEAVELLPAPPAKTTPKKEAPPRVAASKAAPIKTPAPLKPLALREAKRAFKPYGEVEATLDLHGLTKHEAYTNVQQFIARAQRAGRRHVAIITGKGRGSEAGVLRTNLPHWLNEPGLRPMISAFATAAHEKGGSGVTHVLVKRLT